MIIDSAQLSGATQVLKVMADMRKLNITSGKIPLEINSDSNIEDEIVICNTRLEPDNTVGDNVKIFNVSRIKWLSCTNYEWERLWFLNFAYIVTLD